MADSRPFAIKYPEFERELIALQKKYDIILFPMIQRAPSSDTAVLQVIDDNDEETKKKFGIISKPTGTPSILVN